MTQTDNVRFAAALGVAAFHTGITLWYRLPILMTVATDAVSARDVGELNRMVTEKVTAAARGIIDTQLEFMRLATAAMTGKLRVSDISNSPTSIAHAALRPAIKAVKANSRRLRKRV